VDAEHRIADLEAQLASKDQLIAEQSARIAELTALVAEFEQKLAALAGEVGRNSSNSNLPPSSDSPAERAKRAQKSAAKGAKRRRGGQPKHRGTRRELVPPATVDDIVNFFPTHCAGCCKPLPEIQDPQPKRYQLTELPAFEPHTTEYRRHAVMCPCCRHTTQAAYDPERIPASPFGPRLMSVVGLLTGVYHLSRRGVAARRQGAGQAHRRHDVVPSRHRALAVGHHDRSRDGLQDCRRRQEGDPRAAVR
jgi:transposase